MTRAEREAISGTRSSPEIVGVLDLRSWIKATQSSQLTAQQIARMKKGEKLHVVILNHIGDLLSNEPMYKVLSPNRPSGHSSPINGGKVPWAKLWVK
jgi:hypothetical protein